MAKRNINCNQLVELSGVSRVTITAARSGKSCSRKTAEKLAAGLGVPVEALIREG
nr:helix-turn-helix domain-containing protein [uncultured Oscillibacter sp.]